MNKIMTAEKLIAIYSDLESLGVRPILDGGWGVDALLRVETREHKDVDLIIIEKDLRKVKDHLLSQGYKDCTEDGVWWHFFMESSDATVDFIVVQPEKSGGAYLGPRKNEMFFPQEAFTGMGYINGKEVRCLPAKYRVRSLTRDFGVVVKNDYQISVQDCQDMIALCKKFDIDIPFDYTDFMDSQGLSY